MKTHTFRLKPAQDLFDSIETFVAENNIQAGCALCSVGSLAHATPRLANRAHYNEYEGRFEIVSMTGTVSIRGSHIRVAIGGYLVSGCKIYTTAEIVVVELEDVVYKRELNERIEVCVAVVIIFVLRAFERSDDEIGERGHQGFDGDLEKIVGDGKREK